MKFMIGVIIVLIVVGSCLGFYLLRGEREEKPSVEVRAEIELKGVDVKELRLTEAVLDLTLVVRNTGENEFTLRRIDYKVYGDNIYLGDGYSDQTIRVPVGGSREIISSFTFGYKEAAGITRSAIRENQITWNVTGTAEIIDALGETRTVSF